MEYYFDECFSALALAVSPGIQWVKNGLSQKTQWLLVHTCFYLADRVSFYSEALTLQPLSLLQGLAIDQDNVGDVLL